MAQSNLAKIERYERRLWENLSYLTWCSVTWGYTIGGSSVYNGKEKLCPLICCPQHLASQENDPFFLNRKNFVFLKRPIIPNLGITVYISTLNHMLWHLLRSQLRGSWVGIWVSSFRLSFIFLRTSSLKSRMTYEVDIW